MKKLIAIILCVGLCLGLMGCSSTSTASEETESVVTVDRFVKVQTDVAKIGGVYFDIFVDTETNVMYIAYASSWGVEVEPIIDAEGKPLLWEGELK